MKTYSLLWLAGLAAAFFPTSGVQAQTQRALVDYQPVELGQHHRRWSQVVEEVAATGDVSYRTNSYLELCENIGYWDADAGRWQLTLEQFEVVGGQAVARHGPMKVIIAPNLRTRGGVECWTGDRQEHHFASHVLGVALTDTRTGASLWLAEPKDTVGEVAGNQILFDDCFESEELSGGVRYRYTSRGLEQDILIYAINDKVLADNGFDDPAHCRLELFTEWVDYPALLAREPVVLKRLENPPREAFAEPDLVDEVLHFPGGYLPTGSAFPLDAGDAVPRVSSGKSWEVREGRTVLVEKIDWVDIQAQLPKTSAALKLDPQPRPGRKRRARQGQMAGFLPPPPPAQRAGTFNARHVARLRLPAGAFNADYLLLNAASLTNYVFLGSETYFISGSVTLRGTSVFEAGSVLKFTNYNPAALSYLNVLGPVDCQADLYRPVFFVGKDDNSVGQTISGSTGLPGTNHYAYAALQLNASGTTYNLHHLHIRNAYHGLRVESGVTLNATNCQIGRGLYGAYFSTANSCTVRNGLMYDLKANAFGGNTGVARIGEHLTIHRAAGLKDASVSLYLTNCLVLAVTNNVSYTGAGVVASQNDAGVFQSLGTSEHYLAANSPHRDAGVSTINPGLAALLRERTTWPPLLLTNTLGVDTVLGPQVPRDTDLPDLGYHYAPLDYLASNVVANAPLTLTNGVALGLAGTNGLDLRAAFASQGLAHAPNRLVDSRLVQEQVGASNSPVALKLLTTTPATLRFRFTDCSLRPGGSLGTLLNLGNTNQLLAELTLRDCRLRGASASWCPSNTAPMLISLTNNLIEGSRLDFYHYYYNQNTPITMQCFNNLFRRGVAGFHYLSGTVNPVWNIKDNLFDQTVQYFVQTNYLNISHNGYTAGTTNAIGGSNNKTNLTADYQVGPLGRFYYPTSGGQLSQLLNAGSQNATNAGLYHFTVTVNQAKETNSVVDIGFHYVAVDANGNPLDYDGDGVADYLEDANGNGAPDAGETHWKVWGDWGLRVLITRPRNNSAVP